MECIKYINDLEIEIKILEDLKQKENSDEIIKIIEEKKKIINRCKNNLKMLSEDQICYRIYLKILNGLSVSKAIHQVAEENYLNGTKPSSIAAIWENYYPILKKILKT